MEPLHHEIFEKAMNSMNPDAILEVAQCFQDLENAEGQDENTDENLNEPNREPPRFNEYKEMANLLYTRISILEQPIRYSPTFAFGAMARGTPIAGTNGAVIPPGRYWTDLTDDSHRKAWVDLTTDKPEIKIEKSTWSADAGRVIETVIFSIPPTASNYGLPGVFWPTKILGFPTIAGPADSPYSVQSKADTVQRPPPMTHTEAFTELPGMLEHSIDYVAEAAGKAAGAAAKGATGGLGITTGEGIAIGVAALVGLFLLNRLSMPSIHI